MLAETLAQLRAARQSVATLEAAIKDAEAPHLEAARKASASMRAALKVYEAAEEHANETAKIEWLGANAARNAALLQGHETPGVPVPERWIVQQRQAAVIEAPERVPREFCAPDKRLVAEALKTGEVPGARLVVNPVFVYREKATK